jgi:AcrR family transcriptional regulator
MPVLAAPRTAASPAPQVGAQEQRIVDAALRCFSRWGVAKTTLDDVAREAGCSRATVYRVLPGGRDGLVDCVVTAEVGRFFEVLADALDGAADLEGLLVGGMTTAARFLTGHGALQFLLAHEPEAVLPRISFHQADDVLRTVSGFTAPYLAHHLPAGIDPFRAGEWLARIVLSYLCSPSPSVDMEDEASVRRLVRDFVLPGLTGRQ